MTHDNSDATLTLAPAAGRGLGRAVFADLLSDPDFPGLMAEGIRKCLRAELPARWDKSLNGGKGDWADPQPDYRTIMGTVFNLMAQAEGDPVKRILHEHTDKRETDPLAAMEDNPALVAAMERAIRTVKDKRRIGKRAVVDVGPVNGAGAVELDD